MARKIFRVRIAAQLGVHRNTITNWLRNDLFRMKVSCLSYAARRHRITAAVEHADECAHLAETAVRQLEEADEASPTDVREAVRAVGRYRRAHRKVVRAASGAPH